GPERSALRHQAVDVGRRCGLRRLDRDGDDARGAIDIDADETVMYAVLAYGALERRQRDTLAAAGALRLAGELLGAFDDFGFQLGIRRDLIDEAPCDGAL